jgi:predicted amidophosphoribosyltransferase
LHRLRHTDAQTGLDAVERRRNLRAAFALREDAVLPAHVAILDDVFTTGTTLSECARVLKRAGVERVDVHTEQLSQISTQLWSI